MVDKGFKRLGPLQVHSLGIEAFLKLTADKSLRLVNAIELLCEKQMSSEAIPLVRTLIENAINMRWVMNKESGERAELYFRTMNGVVKQMRFPRSWTNVKLNERMNEVGLARGLFYDVIVKYTYEHAHAGSASLDWGVLRNQPASEHWMGTLEIYKCCATMLGHTLQALEARFTGYFADYPLVFTRILPPDMEDEPGAI